MAAAISARAKKATSRAKKATSRAKKVTTPPKKATSRTSAKPAGKTERYAAFLRGVSPMNLKMPDLKRCLERAGYTNVVTVLSSGNVAFDAAEGLPVAELERAVEAALDAGLPRGFGTFVRSTASLKRLLGGDPFARGRLPDGAKRVVTFLREAPKAPPALPIVLEDAQIVAIEGAEIFSAYVPGDKGPLFMVLIEKTFGKDVTTRTWDTVRKVAER